MLSSFYCSGAMAYGCSLQEKVVDQPFIEKPKSTYFYDRDLYGRFFRL